MEESPKNNWVGNIIPYKHHQQPTRNFFIPQSWIRSFNGCPGCPAGSEYTVPSLLTNSEGKPLKIRHPSTPPKKKSTTYHPFSSAMLLFGKGNWIISSLEVGCICPVNREKISTYNNYLQSLPAGHPSNGSFFGLFFFSWRSKWLPFFSMPISGFASFPLHVLKNTCFFPKKCGCLSLDEKVILKKWSKLINHLNNGRKPEAWYPNGIIFNSGDECKGFVGVKHLLW